MGAPRQDTRDPARRPEPHGAAWRESEPSARRPSAWPGPASPPRVGANHYHDRPAGYDDSPAGYGSRAGYDHSPAGYDGAPAWYDDRPDEGEYDGRGHAGREHRRGAALISPRSSARFPAHRSGSDSPWERWSRRRARRREIRTARRTIIGRHLVLSACCAILIGLTPVWVSLGSALGNPILGGSPGARAAEWFRGHGGSPIVNWVENLWYSHHPPPLGGTPASGSIPHLASGKLHGLSKSAPAHLPVPRRMTSPAGQRLRGEGVWHPAGRLVGGIPAVYETWVRPDALHTSLVIGVAWMDTKLLRATLYSGSTIPGGGPYRHTAPVPPGAAKSLVAAFNAGFLMNNANGGYYTDGRTITPLRKGAASFVIYRNGSVNIADWGRDAALTPDVVSVRQNLDLLVDHGRPVPGLNANDTSKWGFTLGNAVYVWRSGVGITAAGALVYAGGPGLNITTLADILKRAGAVRAMELDINTDWVNLATYAPRGPAAPATPASGTDLLPSMFGQPDRYFQSWWARDFFTMSARTVPPASRKRATG